MRHLHRSAWHSLLYYTNSPYTAIPTRISTNLYLTSIPAPTCTLRLPHPIWKTSHLTSHLRPLFHAPHCAWTWCTRNLGPVWVVWYMYPIWNYMLGHIAATGRPHLFTSLSSPSLLLFTDIWFAQNNTGGTLCHHALPLVGTSLYLPGRNTRTLPFTRYILICLLLPAYLSLLAPLAPRVDAHLSHPLSKRTHSTFVGFAYSSNATDAVLGFAFINHARYAPCAISLLRCFWVLRARHSLILERPRRNPSPHAVVCLRHRLRSISALCAMVSFVPVYHLAALYYTV